MTNASQGIFATSSATENGKWLKEKDCRANIQKNEVTLKGLYCYYYTKLIYDKNKFLSRIKLTYFTYQSAHYFADSGSTEK